MPITATDGLNPASAILGRVTWDFPDLPMDGSSFFPFVHTWMEVKSWIHLAAMLSDSHSAPLFRPPQEPSLLYSLTRLIYHTVLPVHSLGLGYTDLRPQAVH